jgi:hypothetical protein
MLRAMTVITAALGLSGCSSGPAPLSVDTRALAGADTAHITGNDTARTEKDTRDIVDRVQVDALYRIVSAPSNQWHRPIDAPLLHWQVRLMRDGKAIGSFGVGANFVELNEYVRPFAPGEQRELEQLLVAN